MYAPPPRINKVVLKSMNCEKLVEFYFELGMLFHKETNENNRMIYTYVYGDIIFEICEVDNEKETTKNSSLRFVIDEIDGYIDGLKEMGIKIIKDSWTTETHQHILINDPDRNIIELMTAK